MNRTKHIFCSECGREITETDPAVDFWRRDREKFHFCCEKCYQKFITKGGDNSESG